MEKAVQKEEEKSLEKTFPSPIPKPKSEEDAQREEANAQAEEILKKTAHIEADRLASLKKELEEVESRIDKKVKNFKKFVDDTEIQGRSLAGPSVALTKEEEETRAAETLIEGTGLSIRPPPNKPYIPKE